MEVLDQFGGSASIDWVEAIRSITITSGTLTVIVGTNRHQLSSYLPIWRLGLEWKLRLITGSHLAFTESSVLPDRLSFCKHLGSIGQSLHAQGPDHLNQPYLLNNPRHREYRGICQPQPIGNDSRSQSDIVKKNRADQ